MTAIRELGDYVSEGAVQYRKGAEIETEGQTVSIYAMPPVDGAPTRTIDVGFIQVGVDESKASKDGLIEKLKAALEEREGAFQDMTVERFLQGPSYIEAGAWIGDQGLALCLFAMLEWFGLAKVITPAFFGAEGAEAKMMLGTGFVMPAPTTELKEALA